MLAELLVEWVLAGASDRLLDPSAGGGVFLDAAWPDRSPTDDRRVRSTAWKSILKPPSSCESGCRDELTSDHIVDGDFFSYTSEQIGTFGAIVGNPPYIRHHGAERRHTAPCAKTGCRDEYPAQQSSRRMGILRSACARPATPGRSTGIGASWLDSSRRLCRPLLDAVAALRAKAELIRVQQLLFDGVQERTVILTVDTGVGDAPLAYREAADIPGLRRVLFPALLLFPWVGETAIEGRTPRRA